MKTYIRVKTIESHHYMLKNQNWTMENRHWKLENQHLTIKNRHLGDINTNSYTVSFAQACLIPNLLKILEKSWIRETLNLLACADTSSNSKKKNILGGGQFRVHQRYKLSASTVLSMHSILTHCTLTNERPEECLGFGQWEAYK